MIKQEQEELFELVKFLIEKAGAKIDVVDNAGTSLVKEVFSQQKLFLLPLFRDLSDLNKEPSILI